MPITFTLASTPTVLPQYFLWRQEWDSNPRVSSSLTQKFSRLRRYVRFGILPNKDTPGIYIRSASVRSVASTTPAKPHTHLGLLFPGQQAAFHSDDFLFGRGGGIRTHSAKSNGFTVRPSSPTLALPYIFGASGGD